MHRVWLVEEMGLRRATQGDLPRMGTNEVEGGKGVSDRVSALVSVYDFSTSESNAE